MRAQPLHSFGGYVSFWRFLGIDKERCGVVDKVGVDVLAAGNRI